MKSKDKKPTEFKRIRKELAVPRNLIGYLLKNNVKTLTDLRKADVHELSENLNEPYLHDFNRLVAISRFDEISPSIEVSNALVKAGLDSILGVSRTSREDLTKVLVDFPEKVLWDTHQHFRAANLILANQEFAARSRYSSGQISSAIQEINDIEFPNCECPDCLSAVGPLAYLADLLDYALEVLRYEDKKLTLSEMEGLLCQPLSDLPTECSQVSKVEISPRLTAEILLKHFSKDLPDHQNVFSINEDIVNAESEYRLHCYTELLTRLGTSYEEIREARLLDRNIDKDLEKLHRIADKIGIDLYRESPIDGTKRDLIDELFRTPDQVTRPWLERTFGLADIERDPLKYGPVEASGEGYDQLSNWDLKGVRWRQNTDFYGQIYVSINADGSKRKVILYRHPNRKKCVAHGEINSNRGTVKLVTEEDSGLSGSVYLSYSYDACDIALEVIPRIVVWRLQHLRSLWTKQYWPDDLPGPIIDPDVISPDDFLAPVAKNSGDPDKAFDIWIKRRQWVDDRRRELMSLKNGDGTPDLAAIFDYMYQKVNYDGVDVVPWADTTQPADFESLSLKLDRGEDIEATKLRIQTDLNLSVESFTRIIEILKKDNLAKIDTRNEKVVKEEWQEVYSILIQAWKEKVYAAWIVEEEDEGVLLGSAQFCISLREPKDGDWPPPPTQQPLIDPHVVDLDDLPDSIVGKRAVEFWHARLDRLDQINNDLRDKLKAEGFEEMLKLALGHPDPGDPLPHDFDALNDNLKNLVDVEATEEKIVKDLHMSVEDFNLLMKVKIGAEETDSSKKPTDDEWAVVYAILTRTQKKKREFPHWVLEESHPTTGVKYWNALKAKLPRWCASHDTRQDWQRQLKFYSQPPLIDIDVIDEYDLRTPSRGDPAFDLWADRQKIRTDYVEGRHELLEDALREVRDGINTTAVDELISQELSLSSVEELQSLSELRASGKNIKPRLDQLCLELNWFDRLVRLKGIELIEDEVNEIIEILWQVHKRRLFGYWHEEEQKDGLTLSPDYFQERTSNAPHERPSNKILSIQCRLDYEDKLSNRINRDEQVQSAGSDLLKSVDAETIVSLRNAFVLLEQEGSDLEEKAKLLCEKRGVDFRSGPNQTSTRVSLAIEALQGLLFGTRNEIRDSKLKLTVDDDEFDEAWQWIGSYATWRAAMFVFMYPENILLPSLHRKRSMAFKTIIDKTRNHRRLTPADAENLAIDYSRYFQDVKDIRLECSVRVKVRRRNSHCITRNEYLEEEERVFLFGVGPHTGRVYSMSFPAGYFDGRDCEVWNPVPDVEGVIKVIGATVYYTGMNRYIYLFFRQDEKGEDKLKFVRYDLDTCSWTGKVDELELPEEEDDENSEGSESRWFIAQVEQNFGYRYLTRPPRLFLLTPKGNLYYRLLNTDGNAWEKGNWEESKLTSSSEGEICGLWTTVCLDNGDVCVFALLAYKGQCYRIFRNSGAHSNWIEMSKETRFRGVVQYPGQRQLDVFIAKTAIRLEFMDSPNGDIVKRYTVPAGLGNLVPLSGWAPGSDTLEVPVWHRSGRQPGVYVWTIQRTENGVKELSSWRAVPKIRRNVDISPCYRPIELQQRLHDIKMNYINNDYESGDNLHYLMEAYYLVPMHLALQLLRAGHYVQALDWMQTIYDYNAPPSKRKIYYGLVKEEEDTQGFNRLQDWLADPIDPHAVAANRSRTYTRYTLLALIGCLLDFADREFTRDTSESVPKARELYDNVLELFETDELKQELRPECSDIIGKIEIEIGDPITRSEWVWVMNLVRHIPSDRERNIVSDQLVAIMSREVNPIERRISDAKKVVIAALSVPRPVESLGTIIQNKEVDLKCLEASVMAEHRVESSYSLLENAYAELMYVETIHPRQKISWVISPPSFDFCIPANPVLKALRMRAENGLVKIRTGRNIAGLVRQLDIYAAPTDATSGMPYIGPGGTLVLPGIGAVAPNGYRFDFLIQRARDLVMLAGNVEVTFLSVLEKRDAEYYNILKAKQDVELSRSTLKLRDLSVKEAEDGVQLAQMQRDRGSIQADYYQRLIEDGLIGWEMAAIGMMIASASLQINAAALSFQAATLPSSVSISLTGLISASYSPQGAASSLASELSSLAGAASTTASIFSTYASYERRTQEWEFLRALALHDLKIGSHQIRLAEDRLRIVEQERNISQMQMEHADVIVYFLANKFTNVELYDWMSGVLERTYSILLQHATSMAQLAQAQLSFERQEGSLSFIRDDYWDTPDDAVFGEGGKTDRRGLTGSARLLADVVELEQYRIETEKRKRQLTRTFSLYHLAPAEFQRFKETGVLNFGTTLEMFDRDFPGQYMRLVHGVRASVIALVPPTEGIRATLTSGNRSIIVQNANGVFQKVVFTRAPESVDLTSPRDATGFFDLDMQPALLRPFEGLGVATDWEFRMPRAANPFDFGTIADVLMTIEYTSLYDVDYYQEVIEKLPNTVSLDRAFSFRHHLPDLWYDLRNSKNDGVVLTFETSRSDFPPNLENVMIAGIGLYFIGESGDTIVIDDLRFKSENTEGDGVGGGAQTNDGIISVAKGNASAWNLISGNPFGQWRILINHLQTLELLRSDKIQDVIFVLTIGGRTPSWPT